MNTAAILLAAGQSRRFGEQDKLLAPLLGVPLISYAIGALAGADLSRRIAVTSSLAVEELAATAGFEIVRVASGVPQSASLAAGISKLSEGVVERVLLMLGDMPCIRPEDITRLLEFSAGCPACVGAGGIAMPPALFPRAMFDWLLSLSGDMGARSVLRTLPPTRWLPLPKERLLDIDQPKDLQTALRVLRQASPRNSAFLKGT